MIDQLMPLALTIGDSIIDLSEKMKSKMDTWSDSTVRPNKLGVTECVGFKTLDAADDGLSLLVDLQVPEASDSATLRLWGIRTTKDDDNNDRFYNLQLDFIPDYARAQVVAKKAGAITRDDLRGLLHDDATRVERIIVSNGSGVDSMTQARLGERYDISADQSAIDQTVLDRVRSGLSTVIDLL